MLARGFKAFNLMFGSDPDLVESDGEEEGPERNEYGEVPASGY